MAELIQVLRFSNSRKPKITIEFPEEDEATGNLTLVLKATLSPDIAQALSVPYVYVAATSLPEDGFKTMNLTATLKDVDLTLGGADGELDTMSVESISKFKITREEDVNLGVSCEIEMNGNYLPIIDFFAAHHKGFEFVIRSRQGNLFEEGTRVDMTGEEGDDFEADLKAASEAVELPGAIAPMKRGRGRPKKNPVPAQPVTVN